MMLNKLSQIEQRKLPVFITLREWADEKTSLLDHIVKQFHICHFEAADKFVERVLQNGECIVLFDGLDEVSQDADQTGIIRQIRDFCDKYDGNQFVISCRVAAYNRQFECFHDVEMADFNEAQIEKFIRNWFHGNPKVAQACWEKLKNSPQLKEMATVPLLLTLLCIAYNRSKDFPPNRADLYEEAIDVLLRDWDATRDIKRDEVYKQLSLTRKKSMFARLAWGTFTENMYFIPERMLTKQIGTYIENLPGFKPEDIEPDSYAVLKSIEAQHGIFVERARKVHSFAHLTFQEFFTAKYIVDHAHQGSLETLVEEHLHDDKWTEVFKLTAEMLGSADVLLLLMQKKNRRLLINESKLNRLLMAVQASLMPTEINCPSIIREAYALAITLEVTHDNNLNRLAIAPILVWDNEKMSIELIHSTRGPLSALQMTNELIRHYANKNNENDINRLIAEALKFVQNIALILAIDIDILEEFNNSQKMNERLINEIQMYLVGNKLIIKCLESGSYVSKNIRKNIIYNLIRPT